MPKCDARALQVARRSPVYPVKIPDAAIHFLGRTEIKLGVLFIKRIMS
jgi:hypothetical protein